MNVMRSFNPRLYEILEISPILMSKAQLSKKLHNWLKNKQYSLSPFIINDILSELTGLPINSEFDISGTAWWDFITIVYQKWIQRFKDLES